MLRIARPIKCFIFSAEQDLIFCAAKRPCVTLALRKHDSSLHAHVRTGRQIQKFVRLVAVRDRFEVLVGMNVHSENDVKPFASSFDVEHGNPILDFGNSLVLR